MQMSPDLCMFNFRIVRDLFSTQNLKQTPQMKLTNLHVVFDD